MSKQTTIAAIASVLATLGLFSLTPPAFAAAPAARGNSIEMRISDLDLKTAEGQSQLNRRIDRAARKVCGLDTTQTGTRLPSHAKNDCYRNALRQIEPHFARLVDTGRHGA